MEGREALASVWLFQMTRDSDVDMFLEKVRMGTC